MGPHPDSGLLRDPQGSGASARRAAGAQGEDEEAFGWASGARSLLGWLKLPATQLCLAATAQLQTTAGRLEGASHVATSESSPWPCLLPQAAGSLLKCKQLYFLSSFQRSLTSMGRWTGTIF